MTCLHPSPLHAVRLAPQPSHQTSRWLSSLHIWLHFQSFVLLQLHLVLKKIFYIQQMQNKLLKDFFISGIIPLYAASLIRFAVSVSTSSTIPSMHSCWNICVRIVLQCKLSMVQLSSICMPDFNSLSLVTLVVNLVLS